MEQLGAGVFAECEVRYSCCGKALRRVGQRKDEWTKEKMSGRRELRLSHSSNLKNTSSKEFSGDSLEDWKDEGCKATQQR